MIITKVRETSNSLSLWIDGLDNAPAPKPLILFFKNKNIKLF